ncbi:hypothetical protein FHS85_005359 [Rhodoligotrophos appendicifer]|uniref:hypothetical protein n=1 Tax=Rhodoligotrophos appendicifer TaxID=987056 RepID=UPI001FECFEC7|nr:hypothetical protein [Rhodoligotrophos appendicifer]
MRSSATVTAFECRAQASEFREQAEMETDQARKDLLFNMARTWTVLGIQTDRLDELSS